MTRFRYDGQTAGQLIALVGTVPADDLIAAFETALGWPRHYPTPAESDILMVAGLVRSMSGGGFRELQATRPGMLDHVRYAVEHTLQAPVAGRIIADAAKALRLRWWPGNGAVIDECDRRYRAEAEPVAERLLAYIAGHVTAIRIGPDAPPPRVPTEVDRRFVAHARLARLALLAQVVVAALLQLWAASASGPREAAWRGVAAWLLLSGVIAGDHLLLRQRDPRHGNIIFSIRIAPIVVLAGTWIARTNGWQAWTLDNIVRLVFTTIVVAAVAFPLVFFFVVFWPMRRGT